MTLEWTEIGVWFTIAMIFLLLFNHTYKVFCEFENLGWRGAKAFWETCQIIYLFWSEEYKIFKLKRELKPGDIFKLESSIEPILDDFFFFWEIKYKLNVKKVPCFMYLHAQSDKKVFVFLCGEETIEVDMHTFVESFNKKRIIKLE